MGETSLSSDWPIFYCPEKLFILLVVHRDQWIIQNYAASAVLTLIETRLSLCINQVIQTLFSTNFHTILFFPNLSLYF